MKISKNNLLYKCYCRYYQDRENVPSSDNLCSFFWTAFFGLLKFIVIDWNFFISSFLFAIPGIAATFLFVFMAKTKMVDYFIFYIYSVFYFAFIIFTLLIFPIIRIGNFVEKLGEDAQNVVKMVLAILLIFVCAYGFSFAIALGDRTPWETTYSDLLFSLFYLLILIGSLIVSSFIVLLIAYFLKKPLIRETVRTIFDYLIFAKNKVCPFVEMPGDNHEQ